MTSLQNRATLREYFKANAKPTGAQFAEFIESCHNKLDDQIESRLTSLDERVDAFDVEAINEIGDLAREVEALRQQLASFGVRFNEVVGRLEARLDQSEVSVKEQGRLVDTLQTRAAESSKRHDKSEQNIVEIESALKKHAAAIDRLNKIPDPVPPIEDPNRDIRERVIENGELLIEARRRFTPKFAEVMHELTQDLEEHVREISRSEFELRSLVDLGMHQREIIEKFVDIVGDKKVIETVRPVLVETEIRDPDNPKDVSHFVAGIRKATEILYRFFAE